MIYTEETKSTRSDNKPCFSLFMTDGPIGKKKQKKKKQHRAVGHQTQQEAVKINSVTQI